MRWSGATGAIARCKSRSTVCARKYRSVPAWPWICGVKPKPKAVNKPSPHSIMHGLDKPGGFTTVSKKVPFILGTTSSIASISVSASPGTPYDTSTDISERDITKDDAIQVAYAWFVFRTLMVQYEPIE